MTSLSHDVLWLNASPSLAWLDRPLLHYLSKQVNIAQWEYYQEQDEGSSLYKAVCLLDEYLKTCDRPMHLIGHGISGVVGLLYARCFPENVRSLTLLGVAAQPAMIWQSHYYVQRHLMRCSRQQILALIVQSLFGSHLPYPTQNLMGALKRDLEEAPSLHSLFNLAELPEGGIEPPLMICGSRTDSVVHPPILHEWKTWLKPKDMLWECPEGRHFFHYFHAHQVREQVLQFWRSNFPAPETFSLTDVGSEQSLVKLSWR
jgi:pimeloyl-ACP methyl ester carboxylesterase